MKKWFVLVLALLLLQACNLRDEASALEELDVNDPVWVFAQINVPAENNGLETYYYYGQVNESLYNKIANGKLKSGFINLRNVRYWNSQDTIEEYSDPVDGNDMVFRIEDIRRIRKARIEPKPGYKFEDKPARPAIPDVDEKSS